MGDWGEGREVSPFDAAEQIAADRAAAMEERWERERAAIGEDHR